MTNTATALNWHPMVDYTIYFDPKTKATSTSTTTNNNYPSNSNSKSKSTSKSTSKSPKSKSKLTTTAVTNVSPTHPPITPTHTHTPTPTPTPNNNEPIEKAFQLYYKQQTSFGLPEKFTKPSSQHSNSKPWEPRHTLDAHDYLSKQLGTSPKHASSTTSDLSFGTSKTRELAIGLVKGGVGNEQILTLDDIFVPPPQQSHSNTNFSNSSTNSPDKSNHPHGSSPHANLFTIDLHDLQEQRFEREQVSFIPSPLALWKTRENI